MDDHAGSSIAAALTELPASTSFPMLDSSVRDMKDDVRHNSKKIVAPQCMQNVLMEAAGTGRNLVALCIMTR